MISSYKYYKTAVSLFSIGRIATASFVVPSSYFSNILNQVCNYRISSSSTTTTTTTTPSTIVSQYVSYNQDNKKRKNQIQINMESNNNAMEEKLAIHFPRRSQRNLSINNTIDNEQDQEPFDEGGKKRKATTTRTTTSNPKLTKNKKMNSTTDETTIDAVVESKPSSRNRSSKSDNTRQSNLFKNSTTASASVTAVDKFSIDNEHYNSLEWYEQIIYKMKQQSNQQTKEWFTNYVKGTTWIGCKTPLVRKIVMDTLKNNNKIIQQQSQDQQDQKNEYIYDSFLKLIQQNECDVKLAGMIVLSECMPIIELGTIDMIQRLENDLFINDLKKIQEEQQQKIVLDSATVIKSTTNDDAQHDNEEQQEEQKSIVHDWSTSDWLSLRVFSKIAFSSVDTESNEEDDENHIAYHILKFALTTSSTTGTATSTSLRPQDTIWYRRNGIVPFVKCIDKKKRSKLPKKFIYKLIDACECNLLVSPYERFTQTGIAWVIRYVLANATKEEKQYAYDMIVRNGHYWTTEAKKSLTEQLSTSNPWKKTILAFKQIKE